MRVTLGPSTIETERIGASNENLLPTQKIPWNKPRELKGGERELCASVRGIMKIAVDS